MNMRAIFAFVCILSLALPFSAIHGNTLRLGQPSKKAPQAMESAGHVANGAAAAPSGDEGGDGSPEQSWDNSANQAPGMMEAEGANAAAAGAGKPDNAESMLYITNTGKRRDDLEGSPLIIPENTSNINFLDGTWRFERELLEPNGNPLWAEFNFNDNGAGHGALRDIHGNYYEAIARAAVDNGHLRIQTTDFVSKTNPKIYSSEFIECKNGRNGAECSGSDGFGSWNGERLFGFGSQRTDSRTGIAANGGQTSSSSFQDGTKPGATQAPSARAFTELADEGAELPPDIMKSIAKARAGKNGAEVALLAGDWRYSQDLARKSDGAGVSLEFHFDNQGNGYSLIKDGSGKPFHANAEARIMPNGAIRVRTDEYVNGSNSAYYPTFMECSAKQTEDLNCDVSNGWTRIEDGRLVSQNAYEKAQKAYSAEPLRQSDKSSKTIPAGASMDEIFAEVAQKAAAYEAAKQGRSMEDILSGVADTATASTSAQKPVGTDDATKSAQALNLPQDSSDASFMAGKWLCQTGLSRTTDGEPVVLEFSFRKDGSGQGRIREKSGSVFDASARATYRNGILRINTSDFTSSRQKGKYNKNSIECRDQAGSAICMGKNGDIVWNAVFLRQN